MRRRALLAASKPSGGIKPNFPIYINLTEVGNRDYRCEPTPDSIAICDYFLQNAVFDGATSWDLHFATNELYIDGMEIRSIVGYGNSNGVDTSENIWWYPHDTKYDKFMVQTSCIYLKEGERCPKGTFRVYDDD